MRRFSYALLVCALCGFAQDAPLESVTLDGSHLAKAFVLDIAGLKMGAAVNRAAIDAAAVRLRDSGIFDSVSYEWKTSAKGGYAVTFIVQDQSNLADASIDVSGVDEDEAWKWLTAQYPQFEHMAPRNDAAEDFIARKLAGHLAAQLGGQKLVARMEIDMTSAPPRTMISFQPENLPRIESMVFRGQKVVGQDELAQALQKVTEGRGFTDRSLRQVVQLNLRRVYEDHGMYRARFGPIDAAKANPGGLAVTVAIEEGPQFQLGKVDTAPAGPLADAVYKAGGFRPGSLANWTELQRQIFDSAHPIKRQGYAEAAGSAERTLHDEEKTIDLKVTYRLGPLYHFGKLQINGLTPPLEEKARQMWKMQAGDAFDPDYQTDFFAAFTRAVDGRQFGKVGAMRKAGAGNHVMDVILSFEMK